VTIFYLELAVFGDDFFFRGMEEELLHLAVGVAGEEEFAVLV
jgi:hypothetical protein